jgi:hypothetical protein
MQMSGPEAKWMSVAAFIDAARRRLGEPAWEEILARLPDDTRALFAAPPAPIAWVDGRHVFALLDALAGHAGGRLELLREISRSQVEHDLRGIYRLFVRIASPDFIAARAASLYGAYWRGNGSIHIERKGPKAFEVVYENLPSVRSSFIAVQLGGIQAAIEATGVKSVRVIVVETKEHGVRARASWS